MTILAVLAAVAALALVSTGAEAAPTIDGTIDSGEYERTVMYDADRYEVHWTITDTELWMGIRAQTTGWVAIGFDPSDRMKDADMVFSWVDSGGSLTIFDVYSIGVNGPHPKDTDQGGTDDITESAGSEASGWTTVEFRRDLSTGDDYDNDIPTTGTIPLIWAVGPQDDFTSQHVRRGGTVWPNDATVEVNAAPSWVYAGHDVEVIYWINLTVWDFNDVTHTAIHWDTMSRGEPLDFMNYPNNSVPMTGEADGVYEASFTAPSEPGTVYMILHAIVDGNHIYAAMEYQVMVKVLPEVTLESTPEMAMEGGVFTVEWMIANATGVEVTHTAVHWDTASQGTPLDYTAYANMVLGEMGMTEGHYHANVTAPDTPGTLYFVVHAIINGMDFYGAMEYTVTVYETPVVTLVMAPSAVVVNGTAHFEWTVTSPSPEDVTHTAIHWDTTAHGTPLDYTAYPNMILGEMGMAAGEYHVEMTAPEGPVTVYYIVHAIVMGMDYYAEMEYVIEVVDAPVVSLDVAPGAVFVEGVAMFEWSIVGASAEDITHTAIHWDTTSHGTPLDFMAYPNALMGEMGMMEGHYHANMTAPSSPTTVYYIVHAIVLDVHVYAEMEYMLDVVDRPSIDEVMFEDPVFGEGTVTVMWNVSMVALEDVTHTAVHWDTTSYGEPLDFTKYANTAASASGSPGSDFKAMFTAPATSGSVFFVVHAIIMDEHFYAEMEYEVTVMNAPEITLVDHTDRVLVGGTANVWWDIGGVDMADVAHTAVHWDTTSHAGGDMDFNEYPNMLLGEDGGEQADLMVMMTAPESPVTVHFIVHAIVMGHDFYAEMEYTIAVVAEPTVTLVAKSDFAYLGEAAKVWWDIDGAAEADLTHTAVHWDTTSHGGGDLDFNAYPNMVLGGDGAPDSDFIAMFDVPEDPFKVYFVVHATVLGEDFYAEMEYSIDVFPEPEFGNIGFKETVKVGDKVTVRFTIGTGTYFERISHVGVHWDTASQGEPLDFTNYANAETVDPNINGVYAVSFNVPDEAGNVYFVIHAIIDDIDHYAEDTEYTVKVEKESDDGGMSTTTLVAIAVVVVILLAIVAFVMMGRGGGER